MPNDAENDPEEEAEEKDAQAAYVKKINRARKTGSFQIGEQKLLDDLYEASQEGAPLRDEIESMQEEIPMAETAADLRELLRTEPDVLFVLVDVAFAKTDGVPSIEEIEKLGPDRFCLTFAVQGKPEPAEVLVDGRGRPLRKAQTVGEQR